MYRPSGPSSMARVCFSQDPSVRAYLACHPEEVPVSLAKLGRRRTYVPVLEMKYIGPFVGCFAPRAACLRMTKNIGRTRRPPLREHGSDLLHRDRFRQVSRLVNVTAA